MHAVPGVALTKTTTVSALTDDDAEGVASHDQPAATSAEHQLAFVPEASGQPQLAGLTNTGSAPFWDSASTSSEWLPGFGAGPAPTEDPWTGPAAAPDSPTEVLEVPRSESVSRPRSAFREWKDRTPRSQIIYTVIGVVCVVAAIAATVVILTI